MFLNIHQKIIIAFAIAVFIVSLYDVLFHFLLGTLHISFEMTEYVLDLTVEHVLETGDRETQIIVFYILFSIICSILYGFYRSLPRRYHKLNQKLYQHIIETVAQWLTLSMIAKMAWWSFFIIAINCWLFLI